MSEVISAVYEGNGLVRLSQEPEGIKPKERLAILVIRFPAGKEVSIKKVGLDGLRQQIREFEALFAGDSRVLHPFHAWRDGRQARLHRVGWPA